MFASAEDKKIEIDPVHKAGMETSYLNQVNTFSLQILHGKISLSREERENLWPIDIAEP